jgi:hypothetical protein
MALAMHNFQDSQRVLPPTHGWHPRPASGKTFTDGGAFGSGFFHILPYIEQTALFNNTLSRQSYTYGASSTQSYNYSSTYNDPTYGYSYTYSYSYTQSQQTFVSGGFMAYWAARATAPVKLFYSSLDPSSSPTYTYVSYLLNKEVLNNPIGIHQITDGSSNTVLLAEGYALCYSYSTYNYRYGYYNQVTDGYSYSYSINYKFTGSYYLQYYPSGTYSYSYNYGYTYTPKFGLAGGKTFQVQPNYQQGQCDPDVPQGLSPGSLQVALADASVRGLRPGMTPATWNAAVTPQGGDTLGSDW